MDRAEVVIVGGGLAGCSAAWHLAPDRGVLLLEQGDQPGAEASAQNAGMVRRLGEDPYERAFALRTAAWLAEPGEDWAESPPSRGAVLGLAHDPGDLHDAVAHLRAANVHVEAVNAAEVAPALAGSPLRAAWYVPDERVADAHGRHPVRLPPRRAATAPRSAAASPSTPSSATATAAWASGPPPARSTPTASSWPPARGATPLAARAHLHRPLIPLRRTLVQTEPHPSSCPDHPWCWIDDVCLYVRPEAGGWLCSPCDERADPPGPGPGSAGAVDIEVLARLGAKLERWIPALQDVRFASGWSGLRTFAPDRRPILGADPALDGLWWAAGLGGFGVTCSYAVGEALAAWMSSRELPWIRPRGVSPGRPFPRRWAIRPDGERASAQLVDVPATA
jgi:D-arginine dehydrogenase